MSTGLHSTQTIADGIHICQSYEYADSTARLAATGFTVDDIGKISKQIDTLEWYMLVDYSPITWKSITSFESKVAGTVNVPAISLDHTGENDCGFYTPSYASADGNAVGVAANNIESAVFTEDGVILRAEDGAIADGELDNNQITFYLDETGNSLKVKVKYSTGTIKTGVILLV